ncbi:leucine-rich repeat-containing protein 15-like [Branchiostoma floridae]|uniref:Leucine-rich repeat-containing protein 15-like n=2 Tax=Branchiostoma floridae TaxID=7739 RepID=A0A9J7L5C6_BRAFL|nr:leucine-rich repeat-containing protein 15-like [Branchiostoma floridae]XP_035676363.1 leucine-rich repeat-containing protein 15-like [Branchiostoma floridae]
MATSYFYAVCLVTAMWAAGVLPESTRAFSCPGQPGHWHVDCPVNCTCQEVCNTYLRRWVKQVSCVSHTTLHEITFPPTTQDISISNVAGITTIPANLFSGLTDVLSVDIYNVSMSESPPANLLSELQGLRTLRLVSVRPVNLKMFSNLRQLNQLDLHNNDLQNVQVQAGVFHTLTSLTHLHLEANSLTYLEPGWFHDTVNLQAISVSDNNIHYIDNNTFQYLSQLSELNLQKNPLVRVEMNAFHKLNNLRSIYVDRSQLDTVGPVLIYAQLPELTNLYLQTSRHYWKHVTTFNQTWYFRGCPPGYCVNSLSCSVSRNTPWCVCTKEYEGDRCDVQRISRGEFLGIFVSAMVLVGISVVIILVNVGRVVARSCKLPRFRKLQETPQPSASPMPQMT